MPRKDFQLGPIGRRASWSARLLGLECTRGTGDEPGVLLLQIDGLSRRQLQVALDRGLMPYLRGLLQEDHVLRPLYAGVPSTTASVQGELFYGVRQAVPAFAYVDRQSGADCAMYDPRSVHRVVHRLEQQGRGLLEGGTAYSQVYTGGSEEARYCIQTLDLRSFFQSAPFSRTSLVTLFHLGHLARVLGLSVMELGLAAVDVVRGLRGGCHLLPELKFLFSRVGTSIALRELIRFRAKLDTVRGVPVVSANFVGYDEHAHRRGPSSAFAHWTLKGIDGVIEDIHRTALRSGCRDYRLIVYSDHGQEGVEPYLQRCGRSLEAAVVDAFRDGPLSGVPVDSVETWPPYHHLYQRSRNLLWKGDLRGFNSQVPGRGGTIRIAALGPLGHLYLPENVSESLRPELADLLVERAAVPVVLYRRGPSLRGRIPDGDCRLPEDAERLLGPSHPWLHEVVEDLDRLSRHPDAGDLMLLGWAPGERPLSFAVENGAHGGPGTEETTGFLMVERDRAPQEQHERLRIVRVRQLVSEILGRSM